LFQFVVFLHGENNGFTDIFGGQEVLKVLSCVDLFILFYFIYIYIYIYINNGFWGPITEIINIT